MNNRNVFLYIAMSIDGYIARKDGDIGWLSMMEMPGEDYGYNEFIKTVDTIIMGRKTYDKVLSFGIGFPHRGKKCYVLSNSRKGSDENVEYFGGNVADLIAEIRKKEGLNIYCDGGAETVKELIKQSLIDSYIISIIPILLGDGIRLFREGLPEQKLKQVSSKAYTSGLVQLRYDRDKDI